MDRAVGNGRIEVVLGDITKEQVDAIVNAANSSLLGGGGVDGAIHSAGGPAILEECRTLGGCETGDAKITTGGDLPARYVIHTVGPVYRDGTHDEARLLASCFTRSLEIASERGLKTVALPAISCGVYGYPIADAAAVSMGAVASFLETNQGVDRVCFVLFSQDILQVFEGALRDLNR